MIILRALAAAGLVAAVTACGGSTERGGSAACGIAAVAAPTQLLSEFSVPGQTMSAPPAGLPDRLVARVAAGPALSAVVGRSDSSVVVGVEGTVPANTQPGFGVLVTDASGRARGVMLYEGPPVEGAPLIGTVSVADTTIPLVGLQVDPARFETPGCPLFPDSTHQR